MDRSISHSVTYGGFLGLEPTKLGLLTKPFGGLPINLARSCFALILDTLKPEIIYLPFYICDSMVDPILKRQIPLRFYSIGRDFQPKELPGSLGPKHLLVYVNYFGLMSRTCLQLQNQYHEQLVCDNSQSLLLQDSEECWSFNSLRKFVGVPDGAFLRGPLTPNPDDLSRWIPSTEHLIAKSNAQNSLAYELFRSIEGSFNSIPKFTSRFTLNRIGNIDFDEISNRRRSNYKSLHEFLGAKNELSVPLPDDKCVPLYYPFFIEKPNLRRSAKYHGLFVPQLWRELETRLENGFEWEKLLSKYLLPLPIDQRYGWSDMEQISQIIQKILK